MATHLHCASNYVSHGSSTCSLNTKARYIRKSSLGRPRLICHSPLTCAGQIQNGGRFEYSKGKVNVN